MSKQYGKFTIMIEFQSDKKKAKKIFEQLQAKATQLLTKNKISLDFSNMELKDNA